MKKQIHRMIEKLKRNKRVWAERGRRLHLESLEGRRLMAADLQFHNQLIAEDVNRDFHISPVDALLVVNALNGRARNSASGEGEPTTAFVDVSGDGRLSPVDALLVINRLRAEGEDIKLVSYSVQITDTANNPITQIVVGQTFKVNVIVQDLRVDPIDAGVFSAGVDLDLAGSEAVENLIRYPAVVGQTFLEGLVVGPSFPSVPFGGPGAVGSDEEFNEINAFDGQFAPQPDTSPQLFFSANMVALKAGSLNITPNAAETVAAGTGLYGDNSGVDLPAANQSFFGASILIVADPTSPVASNDSVSTLEDTALTLAGSGSTVTPPLTNNDTSPAGRALTVTSINVIAGTTLGTLNGFVYTPPGNYNGQDFVTYTVTDTIGLTSTATVTITVTPVNDPPTAVADAFDVTGDSIDNPLDVLANDSKGPANESGQVLTITAVSTPNNGGTVTRTNNNTLLLYTPAPVFDGTETFTYTISDGGTVTSTATVTITVEPGVRPFARRDTATIAEDSLIGVPINVLSNDVVNPGVGVKALLKTFTQPASGTVTRNDGGTPADQTDDTVTYVPNANFTGSDTFTYTMNDTAALGADSTATVTVTVTDVNDPPVLTNDSATGTEDIPVTIAISTLLNNDSPGVGETTSQALSITSVSSSDGTVAIVGSNIVFTPAADRNGDLLFTYTAQDNGTPPLSATATVVVNLAAVNDVPIVTNDARSTAEDIALVFAAATLTTNDTPGPATATDEANQALTVISVGNASSGTVGLSGGDITYTPASNFNGQATFTYNVQDAGGAITTGTVTVTVTEVNDPPVAGSDSATAFKGVPLSIPVATLLANDNAGVTNESGQTLSITAVSNAVNGTVSLNLSTGIITFTPAEGYTGPASFQYTLSDNGSTNGGADSKTTTGTVNITVQEFVPSQISGSVYVDETNDGIRQSAELALGGVVVTLQGTAFGVPVFDTYITLADGSYHFDNLAPGSYTVSFENPAMWLDGLDTAGALGDKDGLANNNSFGIDLASPGGANATQYNFSVLGLQSGYSSILERLASRYFLTNNGSGVQANEGLYSTVGSDNSQQSIALLDGYEDILFAETVLNAAGTEVYLTVVTDNLEVKTAKIGKGRFFTSHDSAGNIVIRILGGMNDFAFTSVGSVPATRYLDAVDSVFAQEGWNQIR